MVEVIQTFRLLNLVFIFSQTKPDQLNYTQGKKAARKNAILMVNCLVK
jgi:hypothetical protein